MLVVFVLYKVVLPATLETVLLAVTPSTGNVDVPPPVEFFVTFVSAAPVKLAVFVVLGTVVGVVVGAAVVMACVVAFGVVAVL